MKISSSLLFFLLFLWLLFTITFANATTTSSSSIVSKCDSVAEAAPAAAEEEDRRQSIVLPTQFMIQVGQYQPFSFIQPFYQSPTYRLCDKVPASLGAYLGGGGSGSGSGDVVDEMMSMHVIDGRDDAVDQQVLRLGACAGFFNHFDKLNVTLNKLSHSAWHNGSQVFNFCHYCVDDSDNYLASNSSTYSSIVELLFEQKKDRCVRRGGRSHAESGDASKEPVPLLFYAKDYLSRRTRLMPTCLCVPGEARSFGFNCGRYQRVFIPLSLFVTPWITILFYILVLCYGVLYVVIPSVVECFGLIRLKSHHSQDTCWRRMKEVFGIRHQSIFFLILSCFLNSIEQIFSFTFPFMGVRSYGVFRIVSVLLVPTYYYLTMIHWAHSCSVVESEDSGDFKSMHWFHRILVACVYLESIYCVVSLFIGIRVSLQLSYALIAIYIGVNGIVLPIGFLFYGIRILVQIKKSFLYNNKKSSLIRLRLTQFVIVAQVVFLMVVTFALILMLTYITNWDLLGLWFGVFRDDIVDVCILIVTVLMMIMLTRPRSVQHAYGATIGGLMLCKFFTNTGTKTKKRLIQATRYIEDDDTLSTSDDLAYYRFTSPSSQTPIE